MDPPKDSTYSTVVALRGLRIVIFLGEINDMEMIPSESGWTETRPETTNPEQDSSGIIRKVIWARGESG